VQEIPPTENDWTKYREYLPLLLETFWKKHERSRPV